MNSFFLSFFNGFSWFSFRFILLTVPPLILKRCGLESSGSRPFFQNFYDYNNSIFFLTKNPVFPPKAKTHLNQRPMLSTGARKRLAWWAIPFIIYKTCWNSIFSFIIFIFILNCVVRKPWSLTTKLLWCCCQLFRVDCYMNTKKHEQIDVLYGKHWITMWVICGRKNLLQIIYLSQSGDK